MQTFDNYFFFSLMDTFDSQHLRKKTTISSQEISNANSYRLNNRWKKNRSSVLCLRLKISNFSAANEEERGDEGLSRRKGKKTGAGRTVERLFVGHALCTIAQQPGRFIDSIHASTINRVIPICMRHLYAPLIITPVDC